MDSYLKHKYELLEQTNRHLVISPDNFYLKSDLERHTCDIKEHMESLLSEKDKENIELKARITELENRNRQ